MNFKLNDWIYVFYKNGEDIKLLLTTKDYKEFIDKIYEDIFPLENLLIIYRDDMIGLYSTTSSREDNTLENNAKEQIKSIDEIRELENEEELVMYDTTTGEVIGNIIDGVYVPNKPDESEQKDIVIPKPSEIYNEIIKYVKGQDQLVKLLSVEVNKQLTKLNNSDKLKSVELPSNPILVIGNSGTGKTFTMETIEKLYNIPFVTVDCSCLSKTGYLGESLDDFVGDLYNKCDGDINKVEHAIIYLDEIDKISNKGGFNEKEDIVTTVQNEVLKFIEGKEVRVKNDFGTAVKYTISTKNMMFVLSGAFEGIDNIVKQRLQKEGKIKSNSIGFATDKKETIKDEDLRQYINKKDLENYGMKTELLGRCTKICILNKLNKDILREILLNENGVLKPYRDMFGLYGKSLDLKEETIDNILNNVMNNKQLGARVLKEEVEKALCDIMFTMQDEDRIEYLV